MPIRIPNDLPAASVLERENIFIMKEGRAAHQDIRPLRIAILNLMPKKIETETQLLRLLGNSPLQVDIDLMQVSGHQSRNTAPEHLLHFYHTFPQLEGDRLAALPGAPVEQLPFQEVDYWEELAHILDWSKTHVYCTLHICWGAQAGLWRHYGIQKQPLGEKLFGVFHHRTLQRQRCPLTRNFWPPIPDTPRWSWRRSPAVRAWRFWRIPPRQVCILRPGGMGGRSLSPVIRSTTGTPSTRSTAGMWRKDWLSLCRKVIILGMTLPRRPPFSGGDMPIFSM